MESAETWLRIERTIYSIGDNFPYWFLCLCTWFFVGFWIWVGFKYSRYCWIKRKQQYYKEVLLEIPWPDRHLTKSLFNAIFIGVFFVGFLFFFIPCGIYEFLGHERFFSDSFKLIENLEDQKELLIKAKSEVQKKYMIEKLRAIEKRKKERLIVDNGQSRVTYDEENKRINVYRRY